MIKDKPQTLKLQIFAGLLVLALTGIGCSTESGTATITIGVKEYQDKVYASWIGQMVGNIYGLVHENMYIEEPGPEDFPYGYDYKPIPFFNGIYATDYFKEHPGAFSDDDTDIEYMYLLQMEEHGPEPGYVELAEAWKHHVRGWVWVANRAALRLMHYGHYPPLTGSTEHNPHWFQIDPQLVNEIWAVTSPGMINYAVEKSRWSARITNDSIGVEPTMFYAAMYSAAFFEPEVTELIDIGKEAIGRESYFSGVVDEMIELFNRYPTDWRAARKGLKEKYWTQQEDRYKSVYNAALNGACSVLALLYGNGDFQQILDLCCAMGWDADNQAATMCGLLAIAGGIESIPEHLLYPLEEWTDPFNDTYINRTRNDLPDASIKDMAGRTAEMGEKVIFSKGGKIVSEEGEKRYVIPVMSAFEPRLELHPAPLILFRAGETSEFKLNGSYGAARVQWDLVSGELPSGISFEDGKFSGRTDQTGSFVVQVSLSRGRERVSQEYLIHSVSANLAPDATEVLYGTESQAVGSVSESEKSKPSDDFELLRDGQRGPAFYSTYNPLSPSDEKKSVGYRWEAPVEISSVIYSTGWMEQHGGWFLSFDVEYLDDSGFWVSVNDLVVYPEQKLVDQPFSQAHFAPYLCSFEQVTTTAIRIIGKPAGRSAWNHPEVIPFINLSELEVY